MISFVNKSMSILFLTFLYFYFTKSSGIKEKDVECTSYFGESKIGYQIFGHSDSDELQCRLNTNNMQMQLDQKVENKIENLSKKKHIKKKHIAIEHLPIITETVKKLKHGKCKQDIKRMLKGVSEREKWAMQMFEASPKVPEGLLQGSFYQLGDFDKCIYSEHFSIQGKYCLVDIYLINETNSFQKTETVNWAICLPSSCTDEQIREVVEETFIAPTGYQMLSLHLNDKKCQVNKPKPLTDLEKNFFYFLLTYIVFVTVATALHYSVIRGKNEEKKSLNKYILPFSLINSVQSIREVKYSELDCIDGIRFLTMLLVLIAHSLGYSAGRPVKNVDYIYQCVTQPKYALLSNAMLYSDTFLMMSAFLMTYLTLKKLEQGKYNLFDSCLKRYLRLTPSYLFIIIFYCTLLPYSGDGPIWDLRIGKERNRCLKSWWINLLYINNYVNTDHLCIAQSWQLAVDFQLFVISSLLIYIVWRWQKIGRVLLASFITLSVIVPIIETYINKLEPTFMVSDSSQMFDHSEIMYFKNFYIKTHMRANCYFVGTICGYLLYKIQKEGIKISKGVLYFGNSLCVVIKIFCIFSIIRYYNPSYEYNSVEVAIYSSLHKVLWCAAVGWVIIICVTKNADLVNSFLSWKFFTTYSRLSYCAFLTNGFIELYTLGSSRHLLYITVNAMLKICIGHLIMTFATGAMLCLFFEIPIQKFRESIF